MLWVPYGGVDLASTHRFEDPIVSQEQRYCPYKLVKGPDGFVAFNIGGKVVSTVELTRLMATDLLASVGEYCAEHIDNAVIAVPGRCRVVAVSKHTSDTHTCYGGGGGSLLHIATASSSAPGSGSNGPHSGAAPERTSCCRHGIRTVRRRQETGEHNTRFWGLHCHPRVHATNAVHDCVVPCR